MRAFLFGPRIKVLGMSFRPGISLGPKDFRRRTRSWAASQGSFVYVIQSEPNIGVKVGITGNPNARLISLQTGCPARLSFYYLASVEDAAGDAVENAAHASLIGYQRQGEWFSCRADTARDIVVMASRQLNKHLQPVPPILVDHILARAEAEDRAAASRKNPWMIFLRILIVLGLFLLAYYQSR